MEGGMSKTQIKAEETDYPILGSYKYVTALFPRNQLCSEMPQSPLIRVRATCQCAVSAVGVHRTERPDTNVVGKLSLGDQLLQTLAAFSLCRHVLVLWHISL
jgi:hypothetical protein